MIPLPKRSSQPLPAASAEPASALLTVTPLDIILSTMRRRYADGDTDGAVALARIAAPYLHARMTASHAAPDIASLHDADLDALDPRD